jgi:hypothetical protein
VVKPSFDDMGKLSDRAKEIVDAFWAAETGCRPEDFDTEAVAVIERPSRARWDSKITPQRYNCAQSRLNTI